MISIIIPNWNGEKFLKRCMKSLATSIYHNFQIIIIDNASIDSDYSWLEQYPNVIFKKLDKNYGVTIAVNIGIKLAKTEYVMVLNNDTEVEADCIRHLINIIKQDKNIFSVATKMVQYYNKGLIDDAGDEYCILGQAVQRGHNQSIAHYTEVEQVFTACSGAAIYRRDILIKIGLFDEHFFAYLDDVDIGYRARIHGYKNLYCPGAVVYHIGSATSKKQASTFTINLINRNNVYMLYKNMPLIQLIFNMPFLIMGYIIKMMYYGSDTEKKQAYKNAVKTGIGQTKQLNKEIFRHQNIGNYIKIQLWLFRGTYYFIKEKIKR